MANETNEEVTFVSVGCARVISCSVSTGRNSCCDDNKIKMARKLAVNPFLVVPGTTFRRTGTLHGGPYGEPGPGGKYVCFIDWKLYGQYFSSHYI